MIKKAVFSYFNAEETFGNKCGFNKFSDFLFTSAFSIFCASKHFPEVQFISSSWGVDLFKELKLPITSYSTKLDEIKNVSKYFWAYAKLVAYCEQDKPFVHIDNDVFLWHYLPDRILNAKLCFQSHEPFGKENYKYYEMLRPCFDEAVVKPKAIVDNPVYDYAYNCGICGGNDLRIFKEWKKCSEQYIFAPENQPLFFGKHKDVLIHQNLFHEQYFLASLIKKHGLRSKVQVLHKDAMKINDGSTPETRPYVHLWGTTKRDDGRMAKVKLTLFYQNQELFSIVDNFCKKNRI